MAVMSQEVKDLFEKVSDVVFATADAGAQPNACIVGMKFVIDDETIYLSDQFFNKTLANIKENTKVAVVFWEGHEAFQIHGTASYVNEGEQFEELSAKAGGESSAEIRARVNAARETQRRRFGAQGAESNAHMSPRELGEYCLLSPACETLMRQAFDRMGLTARSYDRILRVARTIADLDGAESIGPAHLAEAIQYRTYDFTVDEG